jgi:hypothetical protein
MIIYDFCMFYMESIMFSKPYWSKYVLKAKKKPVTN